MASHMVFTNHDDIMIDDAYNLLPFICFKGLSPGLSRTHGGRSAGRGADTLNLIANNGRNAWQSES